MISSLGDSLDRANTYAFTYDSDGNRTTTKKNNTLTGTSRWDLSCRGCSSVSSRTHAGAISSRVQPRPVKAW